MQQYVVKCDYFQAQLRWNVDSYIRKVLSYKKNRCKYTIDIEKAHKYQTEKNALKAAQTFNGKAELI